MRRLWASALVAAWLSAAPAYAATEAELRAQLAPLRAAPASSGLAAALDKGLAAYEKLNDYRARFRKQEREDGRLGPREDIYLKFEKPFKIYLGWLNTRKKGLQVLYERGKHDGKLAIHKPGLLLGLAPVVFLAQDSPWVREGSASYDIEDAGIGTFLLDLSKAVVLAAREGRLRVTPVEGEAGGAYDVRFEGSSDDDPDYFAYRVRVRFDDVTGLPVRMHLFDWENRPMGIYSYDELALDVGAADPEFRKQINRHLYRVYRGSEEER